MRGGSPALAATPGRSLALEDRADADLQPLGPLGPLTDLAIQRIRVSDQVAASEFGTDSPVDDPDREQLVLAEVRKQATVLGLDAGIAVRFFQDQITASKIVQEGLIDRWEAHPDEAPTTRPDLNQIRIQLDQLTSEILRQLQVTQADRRLSLSCAIHLAEAELSGVLMNGLDLHRKALDTALRSVCSPA